MPPEPDRSRRLAILIDADNASPRIAAGLFAKIATLGEASVRRIYGDFSGTQLKGWAELLSAHAIMPHQTFAGAIGKNASDIALVIDAMDLLHTGRFDAFCLVSSDSDFARLAARIREQGVDVYGFGEAKTPESFRRACKCFFHTEQFCSAADRDAGMGSGEAGAAASAPPKRSPAAAVPLIAAALGRMTAVDGWYPLGPLGQSLRKLAPGFDPRAYGCSRLVTLVERSEAFVVRRENLSVHFRPKDAGTATAPTQPPAPERP